MTRARKVMPVTLCETGKRIYWKEHLANRAITEALKRGEIGPLRHYACPVCERWHLSRKNRVPKALQVDAPHSEGSENAPTVHEERCP